MSSPTSATYTAAHWGLYEVTNAMTDRVQLHAYAGDPEPSPIGLQMLETARSSTRVKRPAIRKSWLAAWQAGQNDTRHDTRAKPETVTASRDASAADGATAGARRRRGDDEFVEVEWDVALDIAAAELARITATHGNEALFGGSYGWASAGRFHHAQSQIHRFLNTIGGYVRHQDSYSLGAARALMPYLVASMDELMSSHTDWDTLAENTQLFVTFGGVPAKNAQIAVGGTAEHRIPAALSQLREAGVRFINISPTRSDLDTGGDFEWWPIRPNTDTALLLAIAYTLIDEGLHDRAFLSSHCVGYARFEAYVLGTTEQDRQAKTPAWAADITGIAADKIVALARDMARHRTMLNMAWSLQRAHHGEQPYWALLSVASMLGQIGLPGGGFGVCYGAENLMGSRYRKFGGPTLPQGRNAVKAFIPVARIADMLLQPGNSFTYCGETYRYPDIKLVYWAGGNPFHHHQDLNRLMDAWQRPETIIVNEQFWTPLAKMADIVFPATTSLERNDIFFAAREPVIAAMKQAIPAQGESRDDYAIFAALASRLGAEQAFTEGLDEMGWIRKLYGAWQDRSQQSGVALPDFDDFWRDNLTQIAQHGEPVVLLEAFRRDPDAHKLNTPSGKIEIFSETIASYGYADCPGHAVWLAPAEWLGAEAAKHYPFHLISDQPAARLHSQLDHGPHSVNSKVSGREQVHIHPDDAKARGIVQDAIVRVFNGRGACLAAAEITEQVSPRVLKLSTGAWFDPLRWDREQALEKHGNPNVLTLDIGASAFSQGCIAQTCLVDIAPFVGELPPIHAHAAPPGISV